MILMDTPTERAFRGRQLLTAHLISDQSPEELHEFAGKIGMRRSWFQAGRWPHYDLLGQRVIDKAIAAGAQGVTGRQLPERCESMARKHRAIH